MQSTFSKSNQDIIAFCLEVLIYSFLYSIIPSLLFKDMNDGFGVILAPVGYFFTACFFILSFVINRQKINRGIKLMPEDNPIKDKTLEIYKGLKTSMTTAIVAVVVGTLISNTSTVYFLYQLFIPLGQYGNVNSLLLGLSFLIVNLLLFNNIDKGRYFFYKSIPDSKIRWLTGIVCFFALYYLLTLFI
jgi:hypothetical protein